MRTQRLLPSALILGVFLLSPRFPRTARPVACLQGHPSVKREYRGSWAVFVGRVVSSRILPEAPPNWLDGTVYTVQVSTVFRGHPPRQLDLFSENSSGRFPMDSRGKYVLFTYRTLGRTAIDNCGNSRPLFGADAVLDTLRTLRASRMQ